MNTDLFKVILIETKNVCTRQCWFCKFGQDRQDRAGNVKQNTHVFETAQRELENRSCGRPFSMMTVNRKGQAVLCCSDMNIDVVMGDVREQRLEEIWNGETFHHYRQALNVRGRTGLKLCESCSYSGSAPDAFYPLRGLSTLRFLVEGLIPAPATGRA